MKKIINISGKDYSMQSSAYTQFKYKNDTGRKLMQDINKITDMRTNNKDDILTDLDDMLEILLQITYTMIEEADPKQVGSFDEFLRNTDNLFEDSKWFDEVIELAVSPISRGSKANPQ